jgi:Lrp/AsnC family transcriptional regulator, regulator for asnA, asnC and gidA
MNYLVDELDIAILKHLQKDGRKSFTDIAKALGTAVGTIRNRVTKMVDEDTVRIIGRVNPYRVGFNSPATINVSVQPRLIGEAINEISECPEVSYIALVTGEYNLIVDVMCRDGNHLTDFLVNRLPHVTGVVNFQTSIVLRIHKFAQPDLNLVKPDFSLLNSTVDDMHSIR